MVMLAVSLEGSVTQLSLFRGLLPDLLGRTPLDL